VSTVRLREWRPGDEPELAALWSQVFGVARGGQTLSWIFRPGPAGPPVRVVAEREGRVVAHAGAVLRRFLVQGERVPGAYSVGAMTAPDLQGRGLYVRLGRFLYEQLEERGVAFVAGFSNRRSHHVMTGPLGRSTIRPFPWCVRPLRPGIAAFRALSNVPDPVVPVPAAPDRRGVVPCAPDDPRLDPLWDRVAPTIRVGEVRDAGFGTWRYGNHPSALYRCWLCERGAGLAVGFLALRVLSLRGLRAGFVVDLRVDPSAAGAARSLLRAAAVATRAEGGIALSALMPPSGVVRRAFRRGGFLRVPEALHPQVIRFSVRGLGRFQGCSELEDPSAWSLSWADTDVV